MEIDCDEGMVDMSSVQAEDIELAAAAFTSSCGMVRAGSLREDNHRQKVSRVIFLVFQVYPAKMAPRGMHRVLIR